MSEYIIDLHPNEIEALNRKIVEILNMPEELLKLYTTQPYITEDEQATLEKAANAYQSEKFMTAVKYYRKFSRKRGNARAIDDEKSQLDIVVEYLLSKSLMQMKQFTDLIEARDILIELEETVAKKYRMIYCAIGEIYIKLFCFEDAERMLNKGLGLLNGGNENLINCYIPIAHELIVESTSQGLSRELLRLKKQCMGWHRPDAVCFMSNCRMNSSHHLSGRNIYFDSPAFNGMVVITCNSLNACNIQFHAACWKEQKRILSSGQKMSDKDFLNWDCFTPNCGHNAGNSKIQMIEIHGDDKVIKVIELPVEKRERLRNTASRGATRKQKTKQMNVKTTQAKNKSKPSVDQKIALDEVKVLENPSGEIYELKLQPFKSNHVGSNCRTNTQSHENTESMINHYEKQPVVNSQNDCEQLAGMKSFLYSYFHQFISHNGPIKMDLLQKIWDEASNLIGNCDTFFYDSNCENIIEFLRQSPIFSIIDDYVCTNETSPDNNSSVDCRVSTIILENNEDSEIIFTTDPKFERAASVIDAFACPAAEIVAENSQNTKLISENHNPLDMHDTKQMSANNLEPPYPIERIQCESEIIMKDDNNNNSQPTSPITLFEESNDLMQSVMQQLESAKKELKVKDTKLTDMKITMLRTNLDSQYMTIRAFINSRLVDYEKEFRIVSKMQNALLKYVGKPLPLDEREWIVPIESLKGMIQTLQEIYDKKLAEIHSKHQGMGIDDVNLTMPTMPVRPNRDIPELLQVAFDMCYNSFQSACTTPPVLVPNLYPLPLLSNPPIFVPTYENHSRHWNHVVRPPPPLIPHLPPMTHSQLPTNNNSQTPIPTQSTDNELENPAVNSNDLPKNGKQNPVSDEIKVHEEIRDRILTPNDEEVPNHTTISKDRKSSQDLLMDLLRSRNKGVLEYDLLWCVSQVRKNNNNSLTGLPLSVIVDAVEQRLIQREKLQLADYSVDIQKDVKQNSSNQRLRRTSVSSTSSYVSTASSSRETVIRKNPWKIAAEVSSWQDVDSDENVCAICCDPLKTRTSNPVHKLQCKHSFHRKCISRWLKIERSCPNCRTVAVMDSQFPPLS